MNPNEKKISEAAAVSDDSLDKVTGGQMECMTVDSDIATVQPLRTILDQVPGKSPFMAFCPHCHKNAIAYHVKTATGMEGIECTNCHYVNYPNNPTTDMSF